MYKFNRAIAVAITDSFETAEVIKERTIVEFSTSKYYLLIKFHVPLEIPLNEENVEETINNILSGDKLLTGRYKKANPDSINIIAGLRWVGSDEHKAIRIIGLGLTVSVPRNEANHYLREGLVQPLVENNLIADEKNIELFIKIQRSLFSFVERVTDCPEEKYRFFSKNDRVFKDDGHASLLIENGKEFIRKNISPIKKADKIYSGESSINPAFENLEQVSYKLNLNEKRIWILRSDFVLALGIKNAYQEIWGYHGLSDAFDEENYFHIDWNDRVGHPSLTIPENDYDGSAYYAGHIAQRDGYLELLNYSGRFDRHDLTEYQLNKIEAFVALQFQKVFGDQKVIFITNARNTFADYYELSLFYTDRSLVKTNAPRREYTSETIDCILSEEHFSDLQSSVLYG